MNIDEIIDSLQKAVDEMEEEREHMTRLKEHVIALIAETNLWFAKHEHELPEVQE